MLDTLLLSWLLACCHTYGVEPEFALAVARVESGPKTQEYRVGRLGRSNFYGPMGVHRCFLKTGSPYEVIDKGVRALRGKDKLKVLRRYNTQSSRAYEQAVMALYRQNRRQR